MESLKKAAIDEIEKRYQGKMSRIDTPAKLAQYCMDHQTKYKRPEISIPKKWRRDADKEIAETVLKIQAIENAPDLEGEYIITVEWKPSRMWGMNPKAYSNNGFEGSSIGGCGYDKLSAATAQALNANLSILKLMYEIKDSCIDKSNHELLGYGSGYGILPYFESGVGTSSYVRILGNIGLSMQSITSTKHVDVFLIKRK